MKKIGAVILMFALCLLVASFAMAETNPVVRSGAIAAYTDGEGRLFLPGKAEAINRTDADALVGIDAYRVLFLGPNEAGGSDLYMIDLEDFRETLVARGVHAACLDAEDEAWYVTDEHRDTLMRVRLDTLASETAYTANEPIDRLYLSAEGLVFELVDKAGTMVYVRETERFEVYTGAIPRSGLLTEAWELVLDESGELYIKDVAGYASDLIDSDVKAYASVDGMIYYLTHTGSAIRLKAYDPVAMTWRVVLTPDIGVENQLAATAGRLFLLGTDRSVYAVDPRRGTMSLFRSYSDLSGYGLPAGYDVTGMRIAGMSGQLNVYAVMEETSAKPDFSFLEFESESDAAEPVLRLVDKIAVEGEETAWDLLKPAPQYTPLSRGSRGDAVRAIQQPLLDLGYYDYYVDGIFGPRTQQAVRLLQDDLGRPVDGVADAELQRIILSGNLNRYDPYLPLNRGRRGLRVKTMQERLRDLGYLADDADGIFGRRTQKAVQLFQTENGLAMNESATRDTLMRLYSDNANRCSSFIDLYPGDTGYRVRELNNRLRDLYYLETSPGNTYTAETSSAVRVFQRTAGLPETGDATQAVLRLLFSDSAPEAPGYIVLRRGDENDRVLRLKQRLKELGYYTASVRTSYFGRDTKAAVALFQRKVGLKDTGVATVRTQQLLFADDAPIYVKPTVIGEPIITLDAFDHREDGVYCITDDSAPSGYVTFTWAAEGSVKSYNVKITDENNWSYLDNDTNLTQTGVSISTLPYNAVYTLKITAYPEDGDSSHITSASIRFARVEKPAEPDPEVIGTVGNPVISIDTVARTENGVSYVQPGTITFHWYAEGQVASYFVDIHDEGDESVISTGTTDEQASIKSAAMNQGEIYTIFVYAIPTNGTIDNARVKFMRFALPVIRRRCPPKRRRCLQRRLRCPQRRRKRPQRRRRRSPRRPRRERCCRLSPCPHRRSRSATW